MKTKITLFLSCFLVFNFSSFAQNTTLTLHLNNAGLGNVFDLIQKNSDYIIFYKDDQVNLAQKVNVNADNLSVNQILDQALSGSDLKYRIFDRQIIIIKNDNNSIAEDSDSGITGKQRMKTVYGRVTDVNGDPIEGASIIVKGTYIGMISEKDGQYSLEVPINQRYIIFSFVGMQTKEELLRDRTEINAVLMPYDIGVDEVIVSALGIKRKEKTLTYSTQSLGSEEISGSRNFNFISALSGKISGIEINKSASGAGGSTKISLRGNKSISTPSEPLIVIDGIPMANNKGSQLGMFEGYDAGDGLSQINPDDIQSMSILKGANAAALYGSQGANGVILITTKNGEKGSTKISFSSGFSVEKIIETPDLQFEYGSINGSKESWSTLKGNYANEYVDDFFQVGTNTINTLTVSGGNDLTSAYLSFSNTSIDGIVPQNNYKRNNITFKQSTELLNDILTVSSNIMLSNELTKNKNSAGYYLNPLTGLYLFPRDRNYNSFARDYQIIDSNRNMYLSNWFVNDHFQSNPNWIINNQKREDETKRMIANVMVECKINKNLLMQFRGNYDYAVRSHEQKNKAGSNLTNVHENGSWVYQKTSDELQYGDALLTYDKQLNSFFIKTMLGASYEKTIYGLGVSVDTGTEGLIYPNEFFFQNISKNVMVNSIIAGSLIKDAVFFNMQFGYRNMLFFEVSGRNDWASSLYGTGNDSYFYPSAGIAGIISEMTELPDFISFGKLRASYSLVSNEVPFNTVNPGSNINNMGVSMNTIKPFTNLKPEMIRSFEFGADWHFLKSRIDFDFTYYNINSRDQFIALPAPSGSGFTQYYVNAGEVVNDGIELSVNAQPLMSRNFNWSTSLNYSDNENKILSLHPDLKNPISLSDVDGYQLIIKEGSTFGDLYVHKFLRDSNGRILLDQNGNILKTPNKEFIGNSNPDWSLGWNNNISYKKLSMGILIAGKFGGKVISQTEAMLDGYGVSRRSADARDQGGVKIDAVKPDGTLVTVMDARQYYSAIGDRNGIKEPYTFDRTNIRLSQLTLSYNLKLKNTAIKDATLSLIGQNLFFIYKNAPFDPEVTLNTMITDQALDNFGLPATRSLGFNIKVSF